MPPRQPCGATKRGGVPSFLRFSSWRLRLSVSSLAVLLIFIGAGVFAQYSQCTGNDAWIGDSRCDEDNNNAECGYDGGDCCYCSCVDNSVSAYCGFSDYDCRDPQYAGADILNCTGEYATDSLCSNISTQWVVNDTASATALASATQCSGGVFNVEWHGHVVVNRTIQVANGTILRVTGAETGAEMQAALETPLITVINASLLMKNLTVTGGSATFGGAIASIASNLSLENTSFVGNRAMVEGGAVYATQGSLISCGEGTFDGNRAGYRGGVLSLREGSEAAFYGHVSFTNNNASDGGVLYVSSSSLSWAGDALFINNTASSLGGVLFVHFANVSWAGDATLTNNNAGYSGGGLLVHSSHIYWAGDATFSNNAATSEGGALIVYNSEIHWLATLSCVNNTAHSFGGALAVYRSNMSVVGTVSFTDNTAAFDGGALRVDHANVSWAADSLFANNTSGSYGGCLHVSYSTISWAGDALFTNNTAGWKGGVMAVYYSSVTWDGNPSYNSNAAVEGGGSMLVAWSNLRWSGDPSFTNNHAGHRGGALYFWNSSVSWTGGASFTNNTAGGTGGAVYVTTASEAYWAGDALFEKNSAGVNGGAVYILAGSHVSWGAQTSFVFNDAGSNGGALYVTDRAKASLESHALFLRNSASGDGGAVYVYGSYDEELAPSFNTNGDAIFLENVCGSDGGAVAVIASGSVNFGSVNVTFSQNSAHATGGAISVKGLGVGPQLTGLTFVANYAQIGGAVHVTSSGTATSEDQFGIPAKQPTTFDGCKFIDNEAAATGGAINTAVGLDKIVNTYFAGNMAGTGGALRLAGISLLHNCTFVENRSGEGEGSAVSNVGFITDMTACAFIGNTFKCEPGEFVDHQGRHTSKDYVSDSICGGCDTTCYECIASGGVPSCTEALEHTKSEGGTTRVENLEVDSGYWRATTTSRKVLRCFNADACLGGVTGVSDYCSEGYEGPYCSTCTRGYSRSLGHTCSRCPGGTVSAVFIFISAMLTIIALVVLLRYLIRGTLTGADASRGLLKSWGRPFLSLKINIITIQILTQFASVASVVYPGVYQGFLGWVDIFNFGISWIPTLECSIDLNFEHHLIVSTLGPLVALTILGAMYLMARRRNISSYDGSLLPNQQEVDQKYLSVALLLSVLVYSSVSSTIFRMFACDDLDDGKNYLRADYRIDCNSASHRALQIYAAWMMVVYTGSIPVLYGILLFRNRKVLMDGDARREHKLAGCISSLWKLYKPSCFFYELIECGRRILLAGIVVFTFPDTVAQVAFVLMIAAFFTVVSETIAPYESVWDAWVSRIGNATIFASVYLALLLKIDVSDEHDHSEHIFEALLIAGHVCMFVLVVFVATTGTCRTYWTYWTYRTCQIVNRS